MSQRIKKQSIEDEDALDYKSVWLGIDKKPFTVIIIPVTANLAIEKTSSSDHEQ